MVTLSSGVVIKSKPLPAGYTVNVSRKWNSKEPKPPVEFIESIGRDEANPDNPDYIKAHQEWQTEFALAMFNLGMVLGIEIVEIPDGVPTKESVEFAGILELLGELPQTDIQKTVLWIELVAAPTADDVRVIVSILGEQGGATEAGVAAETKTFRRKSK